MKNEEEGKDGEAKWFIQVIGVLLRNRFLVLRAGIMKGKSRKNDTCKAKLQKVAISPSIHALHHQLGNATIAFRWDNQNIIEYWTPRNHQLS